MLISLRHTRQCGDMGVPSCSDDAVLTAYLSQCWRPLRTEDQTIAVCMSACVQCVFARLCLCLICDRVQCVFVCVLLYNVCVAHSV